MPAIRRHFLGWDRPPIELAAEWLVQRFGGDLSRLVVALPGARAGRLLRERLARSQEPSWQPPRILTAGHLVDELVQLEVPGAPRLMRTLAWEYALRRLPRAKLAALVAVPPESDDLAGWRRLAGEVRAVFGELAAECLDFSGVLEVPLVSAAPGERRRWQALAEAQATAEAYLHGAGFSDPHRGRLGAIEAGRVRTECPVVLVGVAETSGLLRKLLAQLENVTVLVFAPEGAAQAFDDTGAVVPDEWEHRRVPLPLKHWVIAEGPSEQAACTLGTLAGWKGRYAAEQITVGVADGEVVPFLEQRFAGHGVFARDAAGIPQGRTAPAMLLAGVADYLSRGRFEELASLLRHPDLEAYLGERVELGEASLGQLLDEYHCEHLPGKTPRKWLRSSGGAAAARRSKDLESVSRVLDELLQPLAGGHAPLASWAQPLRGLLDAVYGARSLDGEDEQDRVLMAGLRGLAAILDGIEELPEGVEQVLPAAEAMAVVLDEASSQAVAPRAPRAAEPTVEMMGWLELALDDAPALVVTGFNEGRVPESMAGDSWLPDGLRRDLGLPHDGQRLARDLYVLEWLLNSREQVAFVSGRRSQSGDPLRPSRLAFQCDEREILEHVKHVLGGGQAPEPDGPPVEGTLPPPPLPGGLREPTRWSATAIAAYLASPYVFALKYLARLSTLDDRGRELDPLQFGILAHETLRSFGESDLSDSTDVEAMASFLEEQLDAECSRRFGDHPMSAVKLQRRQLAFRLRAFAERQAQRVAEGWHIHAVEWEPRESVTLEVDGDQVPLVGRIDRIDRHEDGRWAILDYKTGETPGDPAKAHRRPRSGEWISVQLPLYAHLAREVVGEQLPELGYFQLGRSEQQIGVALVEDWSPDDLAQALDVARGVIRDVRQRLAAGMPFELGRPRLHEPILAAVCGSGLLAAGRESVGGDG